MTKKSGAGSVDPAEDLDEAPELTEEWFADAETFEGNTFVKRGPGRPPTGNAKELISVRLSREVVAKLREAGPGWQSQVDVLLRGALGLGTKEAAKSAPQIEIGTRSKVGHKAPKRSPTPA